MTGAGETLQCFTTVLEGDALLKKKLLFWLRSCYRGYRQAEDTIVTSGSFGMIAWPGSTTKEFKVQFR